MRFVTVGSVFVSLLLSNAAISQSRAIPGNARASKPAQTQSKPSLSLPARQRIQRQCSELLKLNSEARQMAAKDLNPSLDYDGKLITALAVSGRQAEILNQRLVPGMDMDALVQLVMLQAALEEQDDLRDLLEEMQQQNKLKQQQRELLTSLKGQQDAMQKTMRAEMDSMAQEERPSKKVTLSRNVDLISGPNARTLVVFLADVPGSQIDLHWVPESTPADVSIVLNGPGRVEPYQKHSGRGATRILQEVTPDISKRGRLWQATLSIPKTTPYVRVRGRLMLTYVARYKPNEKKTTDRDKTTLRQARKSLDGLMNGFCTELANLQRSDPEQSKDLAVQEAVRQVNKTSNFLDATAFAAELSLQDLPNPYEALKDKLDDLNDMSEMTSLRLQMMMDRRSKFIETLSNLVKTISTTQDTLVQNLK